MSTNDERWSTDTMTDADNTGGLILTRDGAVATITVDNPPMNVITLEMGQRLDAIVRELNADQEIRAVLVTSALDGVFIAGADITMLGEVKDHLDAFREVNAIFDRFAKLRQPTVAALTGTTLGGGFELALACDFRIMADGFGEVGLPEVRLGLLPGGGGTQRLPRLVGAGRATEMLMKGMRYGPQQALELGLVHQVVPADQIREAGRKYAESLAKQAPMAVQSIKRLVAAAYETPGEQGLELERELFVELTQSADAQEGIAAFFGGRKPEFTGT